MTYRHNPQDNVRLSTLSLRDWIAASFALAVGAATFMFLAFTVFWLLGMPGPKLWFGSGNIPADIIDTALTIAPWAFFANVFGSFVVVSFFALVRKLRR